MRTYVEMTDDEVSSFATRWIESRRRLSLLLVPAAVALLFVLNIGIGLPAYWLALSVGIPAGLTMVVLAVGAMAAVPLAAVAHLRLLRCPNCRTYLIRSPREALRWAVPGVALLFLAAAAAAVGGVGGSLADLITSGLGVFLIWRGLMRWRDPCPQCHFVLSSAKRETWQRLAAVEKLTDRTRLAEVAKNEEEDWDVRQAALSRLVDLVVSDRLDQARPEPETGRLSAQMALVELARGDSDSSVRVVATKKVTEQAVLADIADSDRDAAVRMAAKERLRALLK